ncbi:MAG TPA: FixH family protein [Polyangiaceae bacterium]|nr:FixH family protein [Polyangiaceae bacterium]
MATAPFPGTLACRVMLRFAFLLGIFSAAALVATGGCSSTSPTLSADDAGALGGEGGSFSGTVSCADDPRVDTYTAKLVKPGDKGVLSFELTESDPAPPAKGANTWTLTITDADGNAMNGTLAVDLFMPDHGHGTSVPPVVSFDDAAGTYTVKPVYLFMPGVWRITLDYFAEPTDKKPLDEAIFYFCVEG